MPNNQFSTEALSRQRGLKQQQVQVDTFNAFLCRPLACGFQRDANFIRILPFFLNRLLGRDKFYNVAKSCRIDTVLPR